MHRERRALRRRLMLRCSHAADAHIVNISVNGCLVESRATPKLGDPIEITAELRGRPGLLRGVVVHVRSGFEFAMRFDGLDDDTAGLVRAVATS